MMRRSFGALIAMSDMDFSMMMNQLFLPASLAQVTASAPPLAGGGGPVGEAQQPLGTTGANGATNSAQPAPNPFGFMLPILVIFGVMIFFQIFAGRKERRKRQDMLGSITKYDRVQTVGGLIGTVHDVKDTEVTLKIDESTNTKVHVSRSAIQQVLRKGPASASSSLEENSSSKHETLEAVAS
jgi:preprotein translocase subunit YajC